LEQTKEGKYAYLIGEFAEEKEAGFFLENIVAPRYSKAKVVQYSNGRRVAK
jgi:hypothetical protein